MTYKDLSEEQKELLTVLPDGLPEMSISQQLVLANIILWSGTDSAKTNGYIFRSNRGFTQDTGLSTKSIIVAINNLETKGLVSRKRGKRGEASMYVLSESAKSLMKQWDAEKGNESSKNLIEIRLSQADKEEIIDEVTHKVTHEVTNYIELKFNELFARLITPEHSNYATQVTTESETDIDKDILNDSDNQTEQSSGPYDNAYVTKVFNWLDDELDYLFKVKDINAYNGMTNKIAQYVDDIDKSKFSEKQWECVLKKLDRWVGIENAKEKYFNRQRNNRSDNDKADISKGESTVDECDTISVNPIDSLLDDVTQQGRFFSEEEVDEWVAKEVKKYTSYESWEKRTKDKLNRRFGEDWLVGNGAYAMPLFMNAQKYAQKYYQESHETVQQVDDDELAPWEVPFEQKW